ncbi:zinc finger protein 626-like [Gigantopelta aegis]|uniref:zinc finger protein 626-like n=1 Tax=Gigantopelta aegis TaxID=1735272 RepID=UPI001B88E129|nr:zinc finger protein 626-like [Gigantopelta aegis]
MGLTTVDIGEQFNRWCRLKDINKLTSNEEFATILLNRFEKSPVMVVSPSDDAVVMSYGQVDDVRKTEHGSEDHNNCDGILKDEDLTDEDNFEEAHVATELKELEGTTAIKNCKTDKAKPMNGSQEMDVKTEPMDLPELTISVKKDKHVKKRRATHKEERPQKRNVSVVTRRKNNEWCCETCGKWYPSRKSLIRHQKYHLEASFECETCHKKFHHQWHYTTHKSAHTEAFLCPTCGIRFKHNTSLQRHVDQVHNNKPQFSCDLCNSGFMTKENLDGHKVKKHNFHKQFLCGGCGAEFTFKKNLKYHEEKVCGKRDTSGFAFTCHLCPKAFKSKKNLKQHVHGHNEPTFTCEHCDKVFKWRSSLNQHMRANHNVHAKPGKLVNMFDSREPGLFPHQCRMCKKLFKTRKALRKHTTVHNPPTLICQFCKKEFRWKSSFKDHLKLVHDFDYVAAGLFTQNKMKKSVEKSIENLEFVSNPYVDKMHHIDMITLQQPSMESVTSSLMQLSKVSVEDTAASGMLAMAETPVTGIIGEEEPPVSCMMSFPKTFDDNPVSGLVTMTRMSLENRDVSSIMYMSRQVDYNNQGLWPKTSAEIDAVTGMMSLPKSEEMHNSYL